MVVRGAGGRLYRPCGGAGSPASSAGSGVDIVASREGFMAGIPANTAGSRTGAGAGMAASRGAGAGRPGCCRGADGRGAGGREADGRAYCRGAGGRPAAREGSGTAGRAADMLSMVARAGSWTGGVLAISPTGVSQEGWVPVAASGAAAVPNMGTLAWRGVAGTGPPTNWPFIIVGVAVTRGVAWTGIFSAVAGAVGAT